MVKVSVKRFVSRRPEEIRKEVEAESERLREKTVNRLEEIFRVAAKVARGEIKHQRIDGKIKANLRLIWALIKALAIYLI